MKFYVLFVYDQKFDHKHRPIIVEDIKSATRSFADSLLDPKHPFSSDPKSYHLILSGELEDGEMKPNGEAGVIASGETILELEKETSQ